MKEQIKSGNAVIEEFFSEIMNIEGIEENSVSSIVSLYSEGKLTDKNVLNALDELVQKELSNG